MKNRILLGISKVDITPLNNVQTVGFNRKDNLSRGILHRLYVEIALWVCGDEKCCILTVDSIGFSKKESNILRDIIADRLGITRDKVMLCFGHTHSAPNISLEQEYTSFVHEQVMLGINEAERNFGPVKAVWGNTKADIGINRRDKQGDLDRRIGILKVVDADTEDLRLVMLRITAHANVLLRDNYLISSDFIGVTRKILEEKYNCNIMITQGASGNIKPRYSGSIEALDKMADEIIKTVEQSIDVLEPHDIENVTMFSQIDTFYADIPSMERAKEIVDEAMRESNIDGTNWLKEIKKLRDQNIEKQRADIEIQFFALDEGCLCGVPNEIMCEIALDVVDACNDELIHFGAYTNGCEGYLPTAKEYDKGGYEVLHSYLIYYIYSGIVMPLNRDTADKLAKLVSQQWKAIRNK